MDFKSKIILVLKKLFSTILLMLLYSFFFPTIAVIIYCGGKTARLFVELQDPIVVWPSLYFFISFICILLFAIVGFNEIQKDFNSIFKKEK